MMMTSSGYFSSSSSSLLMKPWTVCAVDLCVYGHVVVSGGENPVVGVGQDGSQRLTGALLGFVKHLGLQLAEFVLEVGEVIGEGVDNAGMDGAEHALIRGSEILGT